MLSQQLSGLGGSLLRALPYNLLRLASFDLLTTLTTLCPLACTRRLLIRTHHGTSSHRHDLPWHHWRTAQPPGTSPAAH
jgi:hypothetical protein